jgi:hypothetical protein
MKTITTILVLVALIAFNLSAEEPAAIDYNTDLNFAQVEFVKYK